MTVRRPRSSSPRLATGALGGLAALGLLTACGASSVDSGELEDRITEQVTEQVGSEPDSVECPEDLTGEEGATTTCVLTADGEEYETAVEVTTVDGSEVSFTFEVAPEPTS